MVRQRHGAAPKKKSAKKKPAKKTAKKRPIHRRPTAREHAREQMEEQEAENAKKRAALAKKKAAKKRASKKKASKKKASKKVAKKVAKKKVVVDEPRGLFTQERVNLLIELVGERCYFAWEAAPMAKVTDRTVRRWLHRGRSHLELIEQWRTRIDEADENGDTLASIEADLGPCPQPNQWSDFAEAWAEAEVLAREHMMSVARMGARVDPKLAFMWLERRYPLDFGNAATRPGIGNNAGGAYEPEAAGEGDPTVELESAIASFLERAAETVDPVKARPS